MIDDFNGPYFSSDLIGPTGRLTRLHKGAEKPKPPPPSPAPVRVEDQPETEAARSANRRNGLANTILTEDFSMPTLGRKSKLGGNSGGMNMYGGEA